MLIYEERSVFMKCKFGFADRELEVSVNEENFAGLLHANDIKANLTGSDEVKRAILNPINSKKLSDIVKHGEKVVIITSDITRPMPSSIVIPLVIEELLRAGIEYEDITIVFAVGSHRKHSEEEKNILFPKIYIQR